MHRLIKIVRLLKICVPVFYVMLRRSLQLLSFLLQLALLHHWKHAEKQILQVSFNKKLWKLYHIHRLQIQL